MAIYETKKILITVKTYPTPSRKSIEASCTAGITDKEEWIRFFPLPFRFLEYGKQFSKYQWIEASVTKASDPRPESYKIDIESIKLLSEPLPTYSNWKYRKEKILPLVSNSLCYLQDTQDITFTTLGIFKPKTIDELIIEPEEDDHWTESELAILSQQSMFDNRNVKPLEKIPYKFKYRFSCNDPECKGHVLSFTDWEAGQAYRNYRSLYGERWEEKFRQKFENEMINKYDTYFYVGTIRAHKYTWIIIGLFYPKQEELNA